LVDYRVTHYFVSHEEAKRSGLKVLGEKGWLTAINSKAKPIHGVAHGVKLQIGEWKGTIDLSVIPWMTTYSFLVWILGQG